MAGQEVAALIVARDLSRIRGMTSGSAEGCSSSQVVVAWAGEGQAPRVPGAKVVPTFPALSDTYALNRCLLATTAQRVSVVQAPGPPLDREQLVAGGGFDHALGLRTAVAEAHLRGRPAGAPLRRLARRIARRAEAQTSATTALRYLPRQLALVPDDLEPLPASARAKSHLLYRTGRGEVLHLYADPSARLLRGVVDREHVRAAAPAGRVPRLHAAVPGVDCLWVLEDEVRGDGLPSLPGRWWEVVSSWLVDLAGPPGPPVARSPGWGDVVVEALEAVPPASRAVAAAALTEVARWPARHQHGDLQPKNVVLTPDGPAAVDWEGVWHRGLPGLDLLFLALLSRAGEPDEQLLSGLLAGADDPGLPVRPALSRLGVEPEQLQTLLTACLALWTRGEARRHAQLGAPVTRRESRWFSERWRDWPAE